MNCQLFETIINDLARASVMDVVTRDGALAHSESCERCAARLRDERMLSEGLRRVAAVATNEQAPARVEAALLAAFRERHSTRLAPSVNQSPARGRARWAIAAAAMILILLALAALRFDRSSTTRVQEAREIKPEQASPAPREDVIVPAQPDRKRQKQQAIAYRPRPAQAQRRNAVNKAGKDGSRVETSSPAVSEIATDFMPIVQGDNLSSMESGQIVRVELPRSALMSFGLPMNMELADERIKADVVLGNDGVARAIRFVR
jgi:hypothetical protein